MEITSYKEPVSDSTKEDLYQQFVQHETNPKFEFLLSELSDFLKNSGVPPIELEKRLVKENRGMRLYADPFIPSKGLSPRDIYTKEPKKHQLCLARGSHIFLVAYKKGKRTEEENQKMLLDAGFIMVDSREDLNARVKEEPDDRFMLFFQTLEEMFEASKTGKAFGYNIDNIRVIFKEYIDAKRNTLPAEFIESVIYLLFTSSY